MLQPNTNPTKQGTINVRHCHLDDSPYIGSPQLSLGLGPYKLSECSSDQFARSKQQKIFSCVMKNNNMPVLTRNQKRKMQNAQQPPPKRLRTYLPEVKSVLQSRNRVPPPLPKRPPLPPRTRPPLPSRPPKAALKATEPRPTSSDMKIRYRKNNTKNKTKEVLFDIMSDFKSLGFESRFVSIPIDEMHSFDDA